MTFIDELIAESEIQDAKHAVEMTKIRADLILAALIVLENKVDEVNQLADDEIGIIEEYRQVELAKLDKKIGWLSFQLEGFIRASGDKTMNLAHGSIKLRMGREKIEITDPEKFLPIAERKGLLKTIPEESVPDLSKIQMYIKSHGAILPGIAITPAQIRFSYKTLKGIKNGNGNQAEFAEAGIDGESDDQAQVTS